MRTNNKQVAMAVMINVTILLLFCSCSSLDKANSSTSVPLSVPVETSRVTNETTTNEIATDYWESRGTPQYAGTYNMAEKGGGSISAIEIKKTALGIIYEVELDLKTSSLQSIEESRLNLGYFYVQGKKILRTDKNESTDVLAKPTS